MEAKEEDGNDGFLGELRDLAELMQEMISRDEVESKLSEKKDVGQGGENKLNSDETRNEQGSCNHQLAALSSTYDVLVAYKKSDLANQETRNVPVSSGEAVPEPSSSDLTNVEIKRVPSSNAVTDSDAKREQHGDPDLASKYNLPDDEEVTNPIDYTSSEYDAMRYQLQESFSLLSIENDASLKQYMSKTDSSSSDHLEAEQPVNPAQTPPKPRLQRQNAMRPQRYTSGLDSGYAASSLNQPMHARQSIATASSPGRRPPISMTQALITSTEFVPQRNQQASVVSFTPFLASKYNLPDNEQVTNPIDYTSSDSKEFLHDASLKQYLSKIDDSSSDHLEAEQAQYGTHEHASDLTFDVRQPVNPPKPRLERQNAMRRLRYTNEVDPGYSASALNQSMPTRQSITTASSHGRRPSISMTKALTTSTEFVPQTQRNQQAMNPDHYSQWQNGNMINSLYTPPNQNEGYNMPPSAAAFQQHGGSNMAHNGYNIPDDEEVTNPIDYTSSDYDAVRYQCSLLSVENDDLKGFAHDASLKQNMSKIDSSSSDHLETEQALYGTHEHASDLTFDVRQPVNPPKPRLQRQNARLQRQNAMPRQRYTSELDPRHSASYLNQPMPTSVTTASSPGRRLSISMTKALTIATEFVPQTQRNQQAMNSHYSQWQYGSMTNSLYTPPNQNESYNMPPLAAPFQHQQGGSNMARYSNIVTSPYRRPEQNDSYNMPPQSDASVAPYAYGSVNFFGTSSDNVAADSRFGYEGGVSRNYLPSTQQYHSGDSDVWPPSSRRSQRQQLGRDFLASLNQQNNRSDPSDLTQHRLWPRDN